MGTIKWFYVTRLKMFRRLEEEAFKAALLDFDQHVVRRKCNPMQLTAMEFKVDFEDGDIIY